MPLHNSQVGGAAPKARAASLAARGPVNVAAGGSARPAGALYCAVTFVGGFGFTSTPPGGLIGLVDTMSSSYQM
jgi:hypothetical protein